MHYCLPHVFALYRQTLRRVTFVGDPKQLGPFGCESSPDECESVFEMFDGGITLAYQCKSRM